VHPDIVLAGVYDVDHGDIVLKEFPKNDPENDFSDPRLITRPTETYLTSISHLRLARSADGINFDIEDTPALGPANEVETFGIEDPRISLIDGTYYITNLSSVTGLSFVLRTRTLCFSPNELAANIMLSTGPFRLCLKGRTSGFPNRPT
jgi:predicted GH43/DUF377 family glycosyl hydrolase